MIELLAKGRIQRVLCIGAHSDDIEIGCGGTILKLLAEHPHVAVRWAVFTASGQRETEARRGADLFLAKAGSRDVQTFTFRDGFLPWEGAAVKETMESLKCDFEPDLIFTHRREDLHQDHALLGALTWNTFRNHLILEYEVPKYDGDLGRANVFVRLSVDVVARKIEHILSTFGTQRDKHWFAEETFRGLMRLRGVESASSTGYAEAFYGKKIVL